MTKWPRLVEEGSVEGAVAQPIWAEGQSQSYVQK